MNQHTLHPVAFLLLLLSACATRSISNPVRPWGNGNSTYDGELSDLDVIGTDLPGDASDGTGEVRLRAGEHVLVVQSGALFPDEQVLTALKAHFDVGVASGIPSRSTSNAHGMRQAAARGGFSAVIAYWGILESRARPTAGQAAAWLPIAGVFVPDERQEMRIRLRIVVVDTRTGRWRSLLPEPMSDDRASSMVTRTSADREQVEVLKEAAYRTGVELVASQLLQP
ncbi:MAG TPA: hypothetical protein VGR31_03400 [Planctomycetota bacterium]|jgi:hypothetical protein|nr:hypothetical protein [Planctomycetota bacterium]